MDGDDTAGDPPATSYPIAGLVFGFNAFDSLATAITQVAPNGTVWVFGGNYPAALNFNRALQPLLIATNPNVPADTTAVIGGAVTLNVPQVFSGQGTTNLTFGGPINAAGTSLLATGGGDITLSGAVSNAANVTLTAGGNVTLQSNADVTASGPVAVTAGTDGSGSILVDAGTDVVSTGGNLTLRAGDDVTVAGGATLSVPVATGRKIYVDVDYYDSDAAGGVATVAGLLTAAETLVTGQA